MPKIVDIKELRKRLKIKKLRDKIPISEFEVAVIKGLRIRGKGKNDTQSETVRINGVLYEYY